MRAPALLAMLTLAACSPAPPPTEPAASVPAVLGATRADPGFERAQAPATLAFPRDHGPHPGFRIEWWYVTANLHDADGHRYGAEFALFRLALRPGEQAVAATWDSGQVFLVHAAVSDIAGARFRYLERSARPALALAGAQATPFRAWVGACEARQVGQGADTLLPLRLRCGDERFSFDLSLQAERPRVLHGARGYSEKSGAPGSASYYYSYPFLAAQGRLRIDGDSIDVEGAAWLDHEWGSAVLAAGQSGWDWFSLRMDDGSALMLFRIRDADDAAVAVRGTLVDADGSVHAFGEGVVTAEPTGWWTSPATGVRYPLEWRLRSQRFALDLRVAPRLRDQELLTSVRYWEGAIAAQGHRGGRAVAGEGYLELTGYRPVRR